MRYRIIGPFPKKKVSQSDKVTPIEEVEKVTKTLDDIKEPVVKIHKKDLDKFQGQSTRSTVWFNIHHEWFEK